MVKEATARIKINRLLESSGWRFFDDGTGPANIRLESNTKIKESDLDALGENFEKTKKGFIDFLLLNERGFPFIVLEAKAGNKDPFDGKEQARKYAQSQKCRFVILSNGDEHYWWDLESGNPEAITAFPSPESMAGYGKAIANPQRLIEQTVGRDYVVLTQRPSYATEAGWRNESERARFTAANKLRFLRPYQERAIHALQAAVKAGKKRFLFEMATGTGKTLTAAALIKLFLQSQNAQRVLFLVDRIELEDQAQKALASVLANDYQSVIFKENREDWRRAEVVVSTVQTLRTKDRYRKVFSPTDFDLVIADEAHRSIGGNARAVFNYFIGYKLGLTATPKDYLKNFDQAKADDPRELERRMLLDTYETFGCANSEPTFRYTLPEAVRDGYLVNPTVVDVRTNVTTSLLSSEGFVVDYTDEQGDEPAESFKQSQFEKSFFSKPTNQLFCQTFLEQALRDPISQEIGKSIIFAVSQNHARKLVEILNRIADKMFPGKYQSDFAVQVTSRIPDAQQYSLNFANNRLLGSANFLDSYRTSKARVCVTVGMMTTGYDCPDLLNLGLFRPIFSAIDFIQIKGRGTRKHDFSEQLVDPTLKEHARESKKTGYKLFDFFAICEYFEEHFKYDEALSLPLSNRQGGHGTGDSDYKDPEGSYQHSGEDFLASIREQVVSHAGMKVDQMFFEKFAALVRADDFIRQQVEAGHWDDVGEYVSREVFDKPAEFYSVDKLRTAASVDRPLTLREILEKALGIIPRFKSKDELLDEEFTKFVAVHKPEDHKTVPALKLFFKAYVTSEQVRRAIDTKAFTELATNAVFSTADLKAVPKNYRSLIPDYIAAHVSLSQFPD